MKINVKCVSVELTPSFNSYTEEKIQPLSRFFKEFNSTGEAEVWVEVRRTTKHHKSGDVFSASADLRLPKKILRAEAEEADARAAIDAVKDKLHTEIEKYRTQFVKPKRGK